jgi:hypothetical protein
LSLLAFKRTSGFTQPMRLTVYFTAILADFMANAIFFGTSTVNVGMSESAVFLTMSWT